MQADLVYGNGAYAYGSSTTVRVDGVTLYQVANSTGNEKGYHYLGVNSSQEHINQLIHDADEQIDQNHQKAKNERDQRLRVMEEQKNKDDWWKVELALDLLKAGVTTGEPLIDHLGEYALGPDLYYFEKSAIEATWGMITSIPQIPSSLYTLATSMWNDPGGTTEAMIDAFQQEFSDWWDLCTSGGYGAHECAGQASPEILALFAGGEGLIAKLGKTGKVLDKVEDVGSVLNKVPDGGGANHIFSGKPGKFIDTPENRKLLEDLFNDGSNYLGKNEFGQEWYAKTLDDGTQIYSYARNGVIKGGGINEVPLDIANMYNLTN